MDVDRRAVERDHLHVPRHRRAGRQTELHRVADERMQDVADERYLVDERHDRSDERRPDDRQVLQSLQRRRLRDGDGWCTVVAAAANGVGAAAAEVVTGLAGLLSLGVRPNSCRAAAIIIHGNGESNGAVGELPANGFRTALTTLDIAVVTTMTGGCGRCFGVSTTTSAMFGTEDTVTLVVGAGSSAALGASAFLVSSAVFTDSVAARTVRAAAVPAFSVFPLGSWVDCREALDFFFFFGVDSVAAAFVSLESVDVSDFSPAAACSPTTRRRTSTPMTTPILMWSTARPTRLPVLRKRRPRFREPPLIRQSAPRTPQHPCVCTYRRRMRCVPVFAEMPRSGGDQPPQRRADPAGAVEAARRRRTGPAFRLDGVAGADGRRGACRPEDLACRRRVRTRTPGAAAMGWRRRGPAAERRPAASRRPTGAPAPAEISPLCRTSTHARSSPGCTVGSTSLRCPNYARSLLISTRGRANSRRFPAARPIPHRLVEQATVLGRELADQPGNTVVHGNLHYENVLAADREPWLAIAPRPMNGDPHYEVAPMLWHRWNELTGNIRDGVRRRFYTLVDAANLDEERARAWVIVLVVRYAIRDPANVTKYVALAKAVQD